MGMKQFFKLKIDELWFGEYVNNELFLTKLSGIDLHKNWISTKNDKFLE